LPESAAIEEPGEPVETPQSLTGKELPEDMTVLKRLPRSDGEEWLIGVVQFRRRDYATARVYYMGEDGKLKPTRHGINVDEELLPEIINGLQSADDLLTERAGSRK